MDIIPVRKWSAGHLDHGNRAVFAPPTQFYWINVTGFNGGQLSEVFWVLAFCASFLPRVLVLLPSSSPTKNSPHQVPPWSVSSLWTSVGTLSGFLSLHCTSDFICAARSSWDLCAGGSDRLLWTWSLCRTNSLIFLLELPFYSSGSSCSALVHLD